jgi:hypothetical protein
VAARSVVFLGIGETSHRAAPPCRMDMERRCDPGFHVGAEITHRVIGTQPVSLCWRALGLSAQIRMRWFPDPSRPKNTTAYLLIGFIQYLPVTEEELRRLEAEVPGLVEPLPEAYES